jgi:hypothetical protein
MHGLQTIVRLNKVQQDFVDHILATPTPDVNLLDVWQDWKKEKVQASEPVQVHSDR